MMVECEKTTQQDFVEKTLEVIKNKIVNNRHKHFEMNICFEDQLNLSAMKIAFAKIGVSVEARWCPRGNYDFIFEWS